MSLLCRSLTRIAVSVPKARQSLDKLTQYFGIIPQISAIMHPAATASVFCLQSSACRFLRLLRQSIWGGHSTACPRYSDSSSLLMSNGGNTSRRLEFNACILNHLIRKECCHCFGERRWRKQARIWSEGSSRSLI